MPHGPPEPPAEGEPQRPGVGPLAGLAPAPVPFARRRTHSGAPEHALAYPHPVCASVCPSARLCLCVCVPLCASVVGYVARLTLFPRVSH